MTTTTETKSYDKRDRAIKAAVAALGMSAKESFDFEVSKTTDKPPRFVWKQLNTYQPKVKDRVYNLRATVDGVLRPDIHGTVTVVGPTVSEVKWDPPAPWGKLDNCLNRHLALVVKKPTDDGDIPDFLKVENRKPLTSEQTAKLEKQQASIKTETKAKQDFNIPKNVEPAGLEILKASGLTPPAKKHANGSAEPKIMDKRGPRSNPFPLEGKITIVKANPGFRPDTVRQKVYDHYKTGMTVAAALAAGVPLNHMKWHVEKGMIKIEGGK